MNSTLPLLLLGLLLATVIYGVLGRMKATGLDLRPRALVAVAITVLCLLALRRAPDPREPSADPGSDGWPGFILLPYAALALAIPLVLLLHWLSPWWERRRRSAIERRAGSANSATHAPLPIAVTRNAASRPCTVEPPSRPM